MTLPPEIFTEKQIIVLLQENNPLAWEHLYNKYATAVYGLICNLTEDKLLANEILIKSFISLKKKQVLLDIKCALLPHILRHTYTFTTNHLKKISLKPQIFNPQKDFVLIHLLSTQCNSLKDAALILKVTVEETKKRLHDEFLNLRISNKVHEKEGRVDSNFTESFLQPV